MEQLIADYIKEYLFDNDVLSIKDLGEFTTTFIPAEIDNTMKVIEPARKKLSFKEAADYTTPSFLQFMAEKNNFSISTSEPYISRFVKTINDAIENNQQISLRGLGKFEPGLISGLKFVTDENVNFLRSTQSMDSVNLPNYNADSPLVGNSSEEKTTIADVIVGDLNSLKDLHNRAFNKPEEKTLQDSFIKDSPKEETLNEVIEEKKTVSEVLSENAKEIDPKNDYDSTPTEKIEYNPKNPEDLEEEPKSSWLWLFPLMILVLLGLMLGQIALSDKPINQVAPFSWFAGDDDTNASSNPVASNENDNKAGSIVAETSDNSDGKDDTTDVEDANNDKKNSDESKNDVSSQETKKPNSTTTTDNRVDNESSSSKSNKVVDNSKVKNEQKVVNTKAENKSFQRKTGNATNSGNSSKNANSISDILTTQPAKGYYIVTGSFGDGKNAVKRYNDIKKAGFNPVVIKNKRNLYQCMVYAPNGQTEARNILGNVSRKFSKDAWITRFK